MGKEAIFYLSRKGLAKNTMAQGGFLPTSSGSDLHCNADVVALLLHACSACVRARCVIAFPKLRSLDWVLGFGVPNKVAIGDHTETLHLGSLKLSL